MSWGYRKRVKIAPGLRLNISRRSVGLSAGKKGVSVSANSRGRRSLWLGLGGFFFRRKL